MGVEDVFDRITVDSLGVCANPQQACRAHVDDSLYREQKASKEGLSFCQGFSIHIDAIKDL